MVITGCTSVFENVVALDFFPTLREKANFKGKICFLSYECTQEGLARIEKFDVIIKPMQIVHNWTHSSNYSNLPVIEAIQANPDVTHIMVSDCGDLWFQKPIDEVFRLCDQGIGQVAETMHCEDPWFEGVLSRMPVELQELIRPVVRGRRMYNSGMVVGERSRLMPFLQCIHDMTVKCAVPSPFGVGQIIANYLIATRSDLGFVDLPWTYNYIPQSFPYNVNTAGELCDYDGEVVTVGHNAGERLVPRFVNGVNINLQNEEKIGGKWIPKKLLTYL